MLPLLFILGVVSSTEQGCLFDGTMYGAGEQITIKNCLGAMTCLGNNNYGDLVQYGGVCPSKRSDGQTGCLFNGKVYNKNEKILIQPCLAEMTCLGNNEYGSLHSLGGVCSSDSNKRDVNGQTGCLFDGRVYGPQDEIIIPTCLGKMTCLGNNNLGQIIPLYGICPNTKRDTDGQSGCLFDGVVYAKDDVIPIAGTSASLVCQGHNIYTEQL